MHAPMSWWRYNSCPGLYPDIPVWTWTENNNNKLFIIIMCHVWQPVAAFLAHCWAVFFLLFTFFSYFFLCQLEGFSPGNLKYWSFCAPVGLYCCFFCCLPLCLAMYAARTLLFAVVISCSLEHSSAAPCEKWRLVCHAPAACCARGRRYEPPVQHQAFTKGVTDTNLNNFQLLQVNDESIDGER